LKIRQSIKRFILSDNIRPCRILRGPFRGAIFLANPQHSLRYIWGLYEHELNPWLSKVIPQTELLLDVGANHGYFAFGVASNWNRSCKRGTVIAFEPQHSEVERIRQSLALNQMSKTNFTVHEKFVGKLCDDGTVTLNSVLATLSDAQRIAKTLIKVDVEGAELDVLHGASNLVKSNNFFLVEVHSATLLEQTCDFFSSLSHPIEVIHQRALPFLGRERRDIENYWVVSSC